MQLRRARRGRSRAHAPSPCDAGAAAAARAAPRARARRWRAMRAGRRAEPQQRMLEQRQQRHRREPAERDLGGQPREHAGRRVGERIAAGIVDRHVPAFERGQRRGAPARGRASPARRSCPAVSPPRASATAMASASSSALAASISVIGDNARRRPAPPSLGVAPPAIARWSPAGRSASETKRLAALRRRPMLDVARARCRCARAAPAWRTADGRRRAAVMRPSPPAITCQDGSSSVRVEPGQHHGAVRQLARWWRAAWRSPASSRSSRRRSPARRLPPGAAASASISWSRRAAGFDRAALLQNRAASARARLAGSAATVCQYSSRSLGGTSSSSSSHATCARRHVVDQPRQIVGERQRGGRRVGDQRRAVGAAHVGRSAHVTISSASSSAPFERARSGGRSSAASRQLAGRGLAKINLVLVDVAERHDARQDRGLAARAASRNASRASRQARRVGR